MKRVISAAAAAALGLAVGVSVLVGPAPSASAAPSCPSSYTCMWKNANYSGGGGSIRFQRYIPDLSLWSWPDGSKANDSVSSAWCSGNTEVASLFENANGTGNYTVIPRGYGTADMNSVGLNDEVSSAYFSGYVS